MQTWPVLEMVYICAYTHKQLHTLICSLYINILPPHTSSTIHCLCTAYRSCGCTCLYSNTQTAYSYICMRVLWCVCPVLSHWMRAKTVSTPVPRICYFDSFVKCLSSGRRLHSWASSVAQLYGCPWRQNKGGFCYGKSRHLFIPDFRNRFCCA